MSQSARTACRAALRLAPGARKGRPSAFVQARLCTSATPSRPEGVVNGMKPNATEQLVSVTFIDPNVDYGPPLRHRVKAPVGSSVVDVAKAHGVDIHAACGQQLQCATCHVILKKPVYDSLQPPGVRENDLLDSVFTLTPTSRLGCQVLLTPELDGVELLLPDSAERTNARMSMDQPRPVVDKQWTEVPASFSKPKRWAQQMSSGGPLEVIEGVDGRAEVDVLRSQVADRDALVARLESELRQMRNSSGRRTFGDGASAVTVNSGGDAKSKEGEGKEEDSDLAELKEKLKSTRVDSSALGRRVFFDDVVGLEEPKRAVREALLWPALADASLFSGLRASPKGLLLYGPPGCGKTMLARAAASELGDDVAFFHIRPGDVMSKFYGEPQRRVHALEELVREAAPSVVFLDEVDSLLGSRDGDTQEHHKSTTNALLAWMDGFDTGDERVFFMGATNRAEAIDEAALRRFAEAAEVGTPSAEARLDLLRRLVDVTAPAEGHAAELSEAELEEVAAKTEGRSFADVAGLVRRAFLEPLRRLPGGVRPGLRPEDVPPVRLEHFEAALQESTGTAALRDKLRKKGRERAEL